MLGVGVQPSSKFPLHLWLAKPAVFWGIPHDGADDIMLPDRASLSPGLACWKSGSISKHSRHIGLIFSGEALAPKGHHIKGEALCQDDCRAKWR